MSHQYVVLCVSGYRHIQLRTQHNESLEVSSLFVSSRRAEECPTGGDIPSSLVSLNELRFFCLGHGLDLHSNNILDGFWGIFQVVKKKNNE